MLEDFDPALLVGKTVKSVEPLEVTEPGESIYQRTDTEGFAIKFTDGSRLELGAKCGQNSGYIIAEFIKP